VRHFFLQIEPGQTPAVGDRLTLDREESHHLSTVLRGGREEILNLVNGRGLRLTARSCGARGKLELVELLSITPDEGELERPELVLACALVKGKHFEWALEKSVELGVHRIIPLATERGTVDPRAGKRDRWATILKSAMKQCGRSWLPELQESASLSAVAAAERNGLVFFGAVPGELSATEGASRHWSCHLEEVADDPPQTLTLLVGPEGGWTADERAALISAGAQPVDLGPHVLRTETAATAGMFALQSIRRRLLDRAQPTGP
jgi:16S rRNA (uracil1498-N3)-methyltransferase